MENLKAKAGAFRTNKSCTIWEAIKAANVHKGKKRIIDTKADLDAFNLDGRTPLMLACIEAAGNGEIVKILLEAGANVNVKNRDGLTPLMCACRLAG